MGYRTGFCSIGCHEGTQPKSASGKPMKVCIARDICTCQCHVEITQMYAMAETERPTLDNPKYIPHMGPDLTWMEARKAVAIPFTLGVPDTPDTTEQTVTLAPRGPQPLPVAAIAYGGVPAENIRRGVLEAKVKAVTDSYMRGELIEACQGQLVPKIIALLIDKDNPPSTGAIGAVLDRWQAMGFADVGKKPIRFIGYTVRGMELGLDRMKSDAKRH